MSSLMGLQGELMRPVKEANTASSVAHGSKEPLGIRFASLLAFPIALEFYQPQNSNFFS